MKKIYIPKKETKLWTYPTILLLCGSFIFGCLVSSSIVLNATFSKVDPTLSHTLHPRPLSSSKILASQQQKLDERVSQPQQRHDREDNTILSQSTHTILRNQKVLVAIASYDFSQIPHLEEVLDAYHDLCTTGAFVDVVIHTTVPYPVTLIDLWNTRFDCPEFQIDVVLKPSSIRLHLVDCHRELFYQRIQQYDLFIYTEDDIRVSPTTVATYLGETAQVAKLLQNNMQYKPSDFNVGIVRYEYNYPANVVIDDKTRHATQNVTRTYWEHSGFERPVVPNAVDKVPQTPLALRYVSMHNHHQGMFIATRELLLAWKDRPKCQFDVVRDRPGKGAQPTEGTQRVWMSSQMLYGGRHCGVTQVLPMEKFGALTVLHLPNKNYRRVGKYRNRTFSDGTEVFQQPHSSLLTAMELHLGMRKAFGTSPQRPYKGIRMIDEVNKERTPFHERRMEEYQAYVARGGVLSEDDMTKVALVEDD